MAEQLFGMPAAIIKPADALAELAGQINAEHRSVETALRAGLEHARTAGELLLKAKAKCKHGEWLPWLKANVRFSERTAQAYMRVAKRWDELAAKAQGLADLTFEDGLELLAAPTSDAPKAQGLAGLPEPALRAGKRYLLNGKSKYGRSFVEIDSARDPGYWVYAIYHFFPSSKEGGEEGFAEYARRGIHEDYIREAIRHHLEEIEFVPNGAYHEAAAVKFPMAYLLDDNVARLFM